MTRSTFLCKSKISSSFSHACTKLKYILSASSSSLTRGSTNMVTFFSSLSHLTICAHDSRTEFELGFVKMITDCGGESHSKVICLLLRTAAVMLPLSKETTSCLCRVFFSPVHPHASVNDAFPVFDFELVPKLQLDVCL
eukprot:Gb_38671 [translate_table: standard]